MSIRKILFFVLSKFLVKVLGEKQRSKDLYRRYVVSQSPELHIYSTENRSALHIGALKIQPKRKHKKNFNEKAVV